MSKTDAKKAFLQYKKLFLYTFLDIKSVPSISHEKCKEVSFLVELFLLII